MLKRLATAIAGMFATTSTAARAADSPSLPDLTPQMYEGFPFPVVTVPGVSAMRAWEALREREGHWPVMVGDDEALGQVMETFAFMTSEEGAGADHHAGQVAILERARTIELPGALEQLFRDEFGEDAIEPELGQWPARGASAQPGLTLASDILTGRPFPQVHIILLPTDDFTEVPAYLRWGGWNACPSPEVHVAMLRRWREQWGIELIGMSGDVMNLRASRRPKTRDAALALAREQFLYCNDIVHQGTSDMAPLAASLMESDWWYFWWD